MADVGRRDFLKIFGLAGTAAAVTGCSEPTRHLIPFIFPEEDIVPGKATWYASTCRECPAGCGLLAKNREGRIVKVEGNPAHPVSRGKLCVRGQASLHGLYNPDRFNGPMARTPQGDLEPISWDRAHELLSGKLAELLKKGPGAGVYLVTGLITDTLKDLSQHWVSEMGNPGGHLMAEPFAYEPLRKANQIVFGQDAVPSYRIEDADFLISFNAPFLETWISNLEYARQFAAFHAPKGAAKNGFVFVGPRLSMTASNADLWVQTPPGTEWLIGLGMLGVIASENLVPGISAERRAALAATASAWPLEKISGATGVEQRVIRDLAIRFSTAKKPLALADGLSLSGPHATEGAVAANLLCTLKPESMQAIDFAAPSVYSQAARAEKMVAIVSKMRAGEVELLLCYDVNPAYSLPRSFGFAEALKSVPMVVSFSSAVDETSTLAHLIMPAHTPLESWGDYSPRPGVTGLMQPVMGPVFNSKHIGDILLASGKKVKGADKFPWKDFYDALQDSWSKRQQDAGAQGAFEQFWETVLMRGGYWKEVAVKTPSPPPAPAPLVPFSFPGLEPVQKAAAAGGLPLTIYPTVQFFDGRQANRYWLQELPDPMTQVTWDGWIEIHPETAAGLGIERNDLVRVSSQYGTIELSALPGPTVPRGVIAIPAGQGHTAFGRFASGRAANPMTLFPPGTDPFSGGILRPHLTVSLQKTGDSLLLANTDGSYTDQGRGFLQRITLDERNSAVAENRRPELHWPMPDGYKRDRDFYPPHEHEDYRWCMVVDLDRCIGCAACIVACYAENNVALVGKEQVLKGREMSWLRVQRYFDPQKPLASWLPMLCQHCDNATCEYVCPVYAPHHSKEGLNNQVYNRCLGTRFCSQNDPYKVRRFNWFTFTRPTPLEWQLNPDVTVRQKGVMEKCSFCVHRIIEAKIKARNEGRKVRDSDFTTACAQTCPVDALTFGSLLDPESRVSKLMRDVRAYQVLMHLNTKPAVIYLKRITNDIVSV